VYNKFARSSSFQRECSARFSNLAGEFEETDYHHTLEPGAGPGPGVLEYYTGLAGESDSEVTSEGYAESSTSYVMADTRQMMEFPEGRSGNMMVDRLLNDLRDNARESEEEKLPAADREEKVIQQSATPARETVMPTKLNDKSLVSTPNVIESEHFQGKASRENQAILITDHISDNASDVSSGTPSGHKGQASSRPAEEEDVYIPDQPSHELKADHALSEEETVEDMTALGTSVESGSLGRSNPLFSGPGSRPAALLRSV
jgi:hypothetical protein